MKYVSLVVILFLFQISNSFKFAPQILFDENSTVFDYLIEIIQSNSNSTNFEKFYLNNPNCMKSFSSAFINNTEIYSLLDKSDLKEYQNRNIFSCVSSEKIYILFKYFLCNQKFCKYTYSGICLPNKCFDFYNFLFNVLENKQFDKFLSKIVRNLIIEIIKF